MSKQWRAIVCWCAVAIVGGCDVVPEPADAPPKRPAKTKARATPAPAIAKEEVEAFCGACHAAPVAASFPKQAWDREVQRGFEFYVQSGRSDLKPPAMADVTAFYRELAPEQLDLSACLGDGDLDRERFRVESVVWNSDDDGGQYTPAISAVQWIERRLFASDMRTGQVFELELRGEPGGVRVRRIAQLKHPARIASLPSNEGTRLLVADLGSYHPADHKSGRVVELAETQEGLWRERVCLRGVGRVADVRVFDINGDGDQDAIAAVFGWHTTGSLRWWNGPLPSSLPANPNWRTLDRRPGAIHSVPADMDGDGRPELVVLLSQEHERIESWAYGEDGWTRTTLFAAPDPAFGSSSIEVCDLDGDGDQDVLYANGDTFDSHYIKPYHGVHWLENTGEFPLKARMLAVMPGVHRALPADLDGDGDLDIVAAAMLPDRLINQAPDAARMDSIVWLEQTQPGRFERHSLERGDHHHATLEVGDFDSDGDIDLAVGGFYELGQNPVATLWWNTRSGSR